jgi:oligopeptide transport system substrate-binding protein
MFVLAVLAIAAFVATGCKKKDDDNGGSSSSSKVKQTLVAVMPGEPTSMDPAKIAELDNSNINNNLFAGLTEFYGDEVVPGLAEKWDTSEDGKTVTFHLRDGLMWSNGDPLTASDVVYGVLRSLDPKTGAGFAYQMFDIVGAPEYNGGKGKKEAVGVKAVDDTTVEFTLSHPVPWFAQLVSLGVYYPLPQATVEKFGAKWTEPENIVTSGPFLLKSWKHKDSMVMTKNDKFWDADNVALKEIDYDMEGNPERAFARFKDGEIMTGIPSAMLGAGQIDEAKSDDRYYSQPTLSTQYLWLNSNSPKLKDVKVRKAIAIAIDRQSIVEDITKAGEEPLGTVSPSGLPGYDTIKEGTQDFLQPEPDYEQAKKLLADAGWKDGDELNVYFTTEGSDTSQKVATFLQSEFDKIGINLKLMAIPSAATLYGKATRPIDPKLDSMLLGWIADYADAYDWQVLLTCDSSYNVSEVCNKDYDKVVKESGAEPDDDARYKLQSEAEGMQVGPDGLFGAVPLYQGVEKTMVQKYVDGFEIGTNGLIDWKKIKITEHDA